MSYLPHREAFTVALLKNVTDPSEPDHGCWAATVVAPSGVVHTTGLHDTRDDAWVAARAFLVEYRRHSYRVTTPLEAA